MHSSTRYRPLAVLILCLALSMFMMSSGRNPVAALLQGAARPLQGAIASTASEVSDFWARYVDLFEVEQANESLLRERNQLRTQLLALREARLERDRLQVLLGFRDSLARPAIAARVIGWDSSQYAESITCDHGQDDGVKANMSVATGEGLVGRVLKVSRHSAQIQIVLDQLSNVAGLLQRTRVPGIVTGQGPDRPLLLRYVPKSAEVKIGDPVLSSGLDGLYHKGLLIGLVSKVETDNSSLFQSIEVQPSVPLERLEEILLFEPLTEDAAPPPTN